MTLCGGVGGEKTATEDVQSLVDSVRQDILSKLGSEPAQLRATHYQSQVVAGTNYFIRVNLGHPDKHVHVRIYKHFSGSVALHGVKHHEDGGVGLDVALEYFEQNVN